ncbi:hypothetical protein [Nocardia altamirensis]|uniref:hypothetical protein n=1 Tax=Nocardia altamirensis TaxID=472158 RepID=UPI00083FE131|nr:hypothetical protein [Nocardia altamirensis]
MRGFEVYPAALRAASDAARLAADGVRTLKVSRVAELAAALPGTESAGTAGELGRHWETTTKQWADAMASYASTMTAAAKEYEAQDKTNAHVIGRTGGR